MATKNASSQPGYKLRLLRQQLARRKANLLDPNWFPRYEDDKRRFPRFYPGMRTAAYIGLYQDLTAVARGHGTGYPRLTFSHRMGPAPMLDPMVPEVIEEVLP